MSGDPFLKLKVGDTAYVEKKILREDVDAFARLTGDYNRLHMDEEFAARTPFSQRVVHGFLHGSLLSTLVGMKIPGDGALYMSQELDFVAPVFIDDTVKAVGVIEEVIQPSRMIVMKTEVVNQKGTVVIQGKAKVKVHQLPEWIAEETVKPKISKRKMLENKKILITGASRGIGKSIAETFAGQGATVWLNYHKSEGAVNELIENHQGEGHFEKIQADVTDEQQVQKMFSTIEERGGLDVLINNAGPHIKSSSFQELEWSDMSEAFDKIVGAVFKVTQCSLPMLKASRGKIINVVSSAALGRTAYNWLPYVTAKNAIIGMSKNLAQELGPAGVRVNMISPSMVNTDLVSNVPEKFRQMMVGQTPLRRMANTQDVAGAALFLASDLSDFMTGDNLLVTGGQVMA